MTAQVHSAYDRFTREEFARRGDEIYERAVLPSVAPGDERTFVAIDVESGDFEIGADELTAIDRLVARRPEAAVWLRRIGRSYTYRLGAGRGDESR
jgi:hypothetical protein